jgi:hypothetical protein
MTQDEIIMMAKESSIWECYPDSWSLGKFAKLVAEASASKEREACALIVEANADACRSDGVAQMCLYSNAQAIRNRGEQ